MPEGKDAKPDNDQDDSQSAGSQDGYAPLAFFTAPGRALGCDFSLLGGQVLVPVWTGIGICHNLFFFLFVCFLL